MKGERGLGHCSFSIGVDCRFFGGTVLSREAGDPGEGVMTSSSLSAGTRTTRSGDWVLKSKA